MVMLASPARCSGSETGESVNPGIRQATELIMLFPENALDAKLQDPSR